jgi:hypothetical protein
MLVSVWNGDPCDFAAESADFATAWTREIARQASDRFADQPHPPTLAAPVASAGNNATERALRGAAWNPLQAVLRATLETTPTPQEKRSVSDRKTDRNQNKGADSVDRKHRCRTRGGVKRLLPSKAARHDPS